MKKKASDPNVVIRNYYLLTKPGIIRGNLITAVAGFFLASQGSVDWILLVALLLGVALVVASACVVNNLLDRNDIDPYMSRTKKRATVTGIVTPHSAIIFAAVLGLAGIATLAVFTNWLTVAIGLIGFVSYVVLYGIAKRKTVYGTLVGSISGATPPVAGYTAVANELDAAAWLLFAVLVFWQMPHFYAVAVYRLKEYKAAKLPVLPAVSGLRATKMQMFIFAVLFCFAAILLTLFGYVGLAYLVSITAIGLAWLHTIAQGFTTKESEAWASKVFGTSLIVILAWSLLIVLDSFLQ